MVRLIEGESQLLPIDPRVVMQAAQSTIRSLVEAIVELVTNSDDSYRRLGNAAEPVGVVEIFVERQRGGVCRLLTVQDWAEGMDASALESAVTFAGDASGFAGGMTVRGLFGRGLKEAIIGLGRGTVRTVRDGREAEVYLYVEDRRPMLRTAMVDRPTVQPNGTLISIEVESDRIRCPTFDVLHRQLSTHFALRDIVQDSRRKVLLKMQDVSIQRTLRLGYPRIEGTERVSTTRTLEGFGRADVRICEAKEKLHFSSGDPSSIAGLIVRTEGAILDNRLFGFDADEAAHYFFGWIDCPGIADVLRRGELGVLNPNRSGLDWRHTYCKALDSSLQEILRPLVEEKRRQLQGQMQRGVAEHHRRKLEDVFRLLNSLVMEELEELPEWGDPEGERVSTLMIRPRYAYSEPNSKRSFTVYVPAELVDAMRPLRVEVKLEIERGNVSLQDEPLRLEPHSRYDGVLSGRCYVVGRSYGDRASVVVSLGRLEDRSEFHVESPRQRRARSLSAPNQGLFRTIDFDDQTPSPIQRVSFRDGTVTVFLRFPAISRYLGAGGAGMETPLGSLMLAELINEALCRYVARQRLEKGLVIYAEGGQLDAFNNEVNRLSRKYLEIIHRALVVDGA